MQWGFLVGCTNAWESRVHLFGDSFLAPQYYSGISVHSFSIWNKLIKHVSIKQICKFPSPFPHQITTNNQVSPFIRNCTFNIHVPRPAKQLIRPLQKTVGTQKPLFPAHKWATTSCYYPHKLLGNHLCPGPLFRSSPATLVFIKLIMCQPLCWVPSMVGSCVCWAVLR